MWQVDYTDMYTLAPRQNDTFSTSTLFYSGFVSDKFKSFFLLFIGVECYQLRTLQLEAFKSINLVDLLKGAPFYLRLKVSRSLKSR